ncbi:hypothetical protein SULYE_1570 [Sulfurihydrogenibium yellowstonense SS-5]|uniref:Uncharacterized protein n=1 Tax=Sulfurihydrogenibium yellowstonense SS-5 TaxID=432331 RepID=C4FLW6_9AQUI|nr:hypothetical protein SULYE_1570 [Sulfurihydrogenibium yellowstonense SS-5]
MTQWCRSTADEESNFYCFSFQMTIKEKILQTKAQDDRKRLVDKH